MNSSSSLPPNQRLWEGFARNADWISSYLKSHGYGAEARDFLDWVHERLTTRVPESATPEEVDRAVRRELRAVIENKSNTRVFKQWLTDRSALENLQG